MPKLRYTRQEHNDVLELFLGGVDRVNLEALREAVRGLRADRVRLDRLESMAKLNQQIVVDFGPQAASLSLREALDLL
ncbi:MAG TPA: hypothetical protein VKX25_19615 [Bryobacteraceae bacterium]|jgi:hypothetical protein|nr:hypothetical protein [Bryobacteraceae bacterium]